MIGFYFKMFNVMIMIISGKIVNIIFIKFCFLFVVIDDLLGLVNFWFLVFNFLLW